jgi:hypothetical protein
MRKIVGAGADIFDKLEQEPHKHKPALQHWTQIQKEQKDKVSMDVIGGHT